MPQAVKDHLKAAAAPEDDLRILLIRQPASRQREGITFFVVQNQLSPPLIYEYHLTTYEDLLSLDLKSLLASGTGGRAHLRREPLYLVCTNGKRDQCCALFGPKLYQAMADAAGEAVWQSSHIGGHNLAPNTLFFPHGVNYGRSTPEGIGEMIQAYREGQVRLSNYRGQVALPQHVQAAEYFWREQSGVLNLDMVQIGRCEDIEENEWRVEIGLVGEKPEWVHVGLTVSEHEIPITCAQTKTAPVRRFERVGGKSQDTR